MTNLKILLYDLETSLNKGYFFDVWETNISPENLISEQIIHCISYRWYGSKKIHTISVLDDPKRFKKNPIDDTYVLREFRKVILQADAIVAHNGNSFDIKMLNGRILLSGNKPIPEIKSYDTYRIAKKYFKLNFNSLDYLSRKFGYKGKMNNPKGLWRACIEGNVKALEHMERYNRQDIEALTYVFEYLMPFVKMPIAKDAICQNPICNSKRLLWEGERAGFHRFSCKDCGNYGKIKLKKQTKNPR